MNDEGVVTQQKLRVLYLPAEEGPLEEEEENGVKQQQPSDPGGSRMPLSTLYGTIFFTGPL